MVDNTHTPPERYKSASDIGKPFLRLLGISEDDLARECRLVMEDNGYIHDFYLGNACKYLWRLGAKDDIGSEIVKALDYLRWFRDHTYVHRVPGLAAGLSCDISATIAGLEALQAYLQTNHTSIQSAISMSKPYQSRPYCDLKLGSDTTIPGLMP